MTTGKVIDFEHMGPIEKLQSQLGADECRRLGFVFDDERGVATLATAGFGYLLAVGAMGVTTLAEAFAAGYQCAAEHHTPELEI
jgi:hypothetical protein